MTDLRRTQRSAAFIRLLRTQVAERMVGRSKPPQPSQNPVTFAHVFCHRPRTRSPRAQRLRFF